MGTARARVLGFIIVLLIVTLIAPAIPLTLADGYGENSDSLGQITDEFTSLDNVSVRVLVERNATFNAMELNSTGIAATVIYNLTNLREHDYYGGGATPDFSFSIDNNDEIRINSNAASQGRGYLFLTVDRSWLNDRYVRNRYPRP